MSKNESNSLNIHTDAGIAIDRIYQQVADAAPDAGVFPFTRGVQPDMYRG